MTVIRIDLLGTSFTLQSDEDPDYVADLVDFCRTKIEETKTNVSSQDNLKLAILSSLLIADELFKERRARDESNQTEDSEIGRITRELIARIDETIT